MENTISKFFNSLKETITVLNSIFFDCWLENCTQECACFWAVEGFWVYLGAEGGSPLFGRAMVITDIPQ
jgi:hypothetical protein